MHLFKKFRLFPPSSPATSSTAPSTSSSSGGGKTRRMFGFKFGPKTIGIIAGGKSSSGNGSKVKIMGSSKLGLHRFNPMAFSPSPMSREDIEEDEKLMRRRLILDSGDPSQNRNPHHLQVATDDEVRRSVSIIKAFMTWCSTANPGTQINEEALKGISYEKLSVMLQNCEDAMAKSQEMLVTNQTEMKNYEVLYAKIEAGIIDAHNKIVIFKKQLMMNDPDVRSSLKGDNKTSNIQKYHKMVVNGSHVLNKTGMSEAHNHFESEPTAEERKETLARLTMLEMEVRKLQMIRDDLNRKLIKRRKQCETLVATAHELRGLFSEVTSSSSINSISNINYDESETHSDDIRNNNIHRYDEPTISTDHPQVRKINNPSNLMIMSHA